MSDAVSLEELKRNFFYDPGTGNFYRLKSIRNPRKGDKKRGEAVFAIAELCRESASNGHSAELIYDAIKSGKIVID
ncbi:hypothetical protein [Enterobacter sp. UPMP2052]